MAQFIGTSMTRGFEGMLTRGFFDATTEIKANDGTAPVQGFGLAVKINAGATGVTPCNDDADAVYGISVRVYGQADNAGIQEQTFVTVLRRGYIAVKPAAGTPALGGAVYLNASGKISADSTGGVQIPNAHWMGSVDADGLAELAFNI
jgi:hypothetical protein